MAALDFPNSPTNGDTFTSPNGGAVYTWDGAKWLTSSVASNTAAQNNIGRNLLHNPLFNIQQRGAGPFTTLNVYTLDRWEVAGVNDTSSITAQTASDAVRTAIGDEAVTVVLANTWTGNAAAGAYTALEQPLEDVRRLAGKTVTLSFWAVAGSGTLKVGVNYLQHFGTGGSPSTSAWSSGTGQSVTVNTTWTRYTVTTTLPSIVGKTLGTNSNSSSTYLALALSSGATNNATFGSIGVQSGTINIWGVQLEVGSGATTLEKPDPADDLRRCQRFYQTGYLTISGYNTAGNGLSYAMPFKVTMRAAAIMTTSGVTLTNFGSTYTDGNRPETLVVGGQVTATGPALWTANWTASADL